MFKAEAIWLRRKLEELPAEDLSPLVNLGSSTGAFRTKLQFWTEEELFAPLRARGVRLVHVDQREEDDGIDIHAACGQVRAQQVVSLIPVRHRYPFSKYSSPFLPHAGKGDHASRSFQWA